MAASTIADLSEKQKIAVLLASLNEKVSASILQHLEPNIMAEVANSIRSLGVIPGELRTECISDCVQGILKMGNAVQGDENIVNSLLRRAIGEKKANAMLQEGGDGGQKPFSRLTDIPAEQIATILAREQASVVGVILRFLNPTKAGEILSALPVDIRKQTVVFMCTAKPPSSEVILAIEEDLISRLGPEQSQTHQVEENDMTETMAEILQHVERSVEEEILSALTEESEELGKTIKDKLFTFEDIINLNDVAMRRILQEVDMGLLAVSLRNASMALRDKFFSNMSKRAAEGIKEEMEFAQKMKLSEILERQTEVVNAIRGLEADGQIEVATGGDSDEYV